jgi:hypothetical protein
MKKVHLLLLLFIISACGCPTTTTNKQIFPSCFIICDFSASQGGNSIEEIKNNAREIFEKISRKYNVKIYDIKSAQYTKPLFEYINPFRKRISTPLEREKWSKENGSMKTILSRKLDSAGRESKNPNTCIIRLLTRIVDDLASDTNNKNNPIRIIILSDMLEYCNYPFGNIDLENAAYQAALNSLSKMPPPKYTLAGYTDIEISLIASSQRAINPASLNNFWEQVFIKYGYTLKGPITATLPSWINSANN